MRISVDERIRLAVESAPPLPQDVQDRLRQLISARRAIDDPVKLARAAGIIRNALARQGLTVADLAGGAISPAEMREEREREIAADVRAVKSRRKPSNAAVIADYLSKQLGAERKPETDPVAEIARDLVGRRGMAWVDAYENARAILAARRVGFVGDDL